MATVIRPALSANNKYYLDKHRYYELKHFCLQYNEWVKSYNELDSFGKRHRDLASYIKTNEHGDSTVTIALSKLEYRAKMELIEQTAYDVDDYLAPYIIRAVTENLSYVYLQTNLNIPCNRNTYYDRYRKFFWVLDKRKE